MAFLIRVVYMICHKRQQQENMAISFPGLREALGLKNFASALTPGLTSAVLWRKRGNSVESSTVDSLAP